MNLKDNTPYSSTEENIDEYLSLERISNCKISDLADDRNNDLLVYPYSFNDCDDEIGKETLLTLQKIAWKNGKCTKAELKTGNIVGFIGFGGQQIAIHSRFSHSDEDFFFHYMLEKVMGINLVSLTYGIVNDPVFNYLLCLFPKFFNDALKQGLYKEYQRHKYNDANLKGTVDVNRHLKYNIPFKGSIAYTMRELSYDNLVTELIRHTIEYIRRQKIGEIVLESETQIKENVSRIITATPHYNKFERNRVINGNLKMTRHPYFVKYAPLQKLCLRILRGDRIKYGLSNDGIYGILFDASYLWEEYLAGIFMAHGFKHPNNRKRKDRLYLATPSALHRYPDYYDKDSDGTVIDAKYKRTVDLRDDVNQMITYMYRLRSKHGIFVHPNANPNDVDKTYKLLGYGESEKADLSIIQVDVPDCADSYKEFSEQMSESEKSLISNLESIRKE